MMRVLEAGLRTECGWRRDMPDMRHVTCDNRHVPCSRHRPSYADTTCYSIVHEPSWRLDYELTGGTRHLSSSSPNETDWMDATFYR